RASSCACFLVSARCQLISTRQFLRSTLCPCFGAASSANDHWVGSACSPSDDVDAMDSGPIPYLPASCMPDGLSDDAHVISIFPCSGRIWSWASRSVNHSDSYEKRGSPRRSL